jgi:hypothetical protein
MSSPKYHALVTHYHGQASLLNVATTSGKGSFNSNRADRLGEDGEEDDLDGALDSALFSLAHPTGASKGEGKARHNGPGGGDDYSISAHDDYRLLLLHHWSLAESMYHSPYVAAKLGLWRQKGKARLINLIVKMG